MNIEINLEGDWIDISDDETVVVTAELLREAAEIFAAAEEETADEDVICGTCAGSGEGYYEGSHCAMCGGSGLAFLRWNRSSYSSYYI
jgi:hypothetical protein